MAYSYEWCYFAWKKWDNCKPGTEILQKHTVTSKKGKTCVSVCVKMDTKYSWCYTSVNNEWDYCEESELRLSLTENENLCMTDCIPHGKKHYCYINWSKWENCHPGELMVDPPKTEIGAQCTSLCGTYGSSYNWCFTGAVGASAYAKCKVNSIEALNKACPQKRKARSGDVNFCIKAEMGNGDARNKIASTVLQ